MSDSDRSSVVRAILLLAAVGLVWALKPDTSVKEAYSGKLSSQADGLSWPAWR
jgi:hypothetical protein